jgi:hypothetical protein
MDTGLIDTNSGDEGTARPLFIILIRADDLDPIAGLVERFTQTTRLTARFARTSRPNEQVDDSYVYRV